MTLVTPLGSAVAGFVLHKFRSPPLYVLLSGFVFIILGTGLSTMTTHISKEFPASKYGYHVTMGFEFRINLATVVMAALSHLRLKI